MHLISDAAIKNFANGVTKSFYYPQFRYIAFLTALLRTKPGSVNPFINSLSYKRRTLSWHCRFASSYFLYPHCNFLWNIVLKIDAVSEESASIASINGTNSNFVQINWRENNPLSKNKYLPHQRQSSEKLWSGDRVSQWKALGLWFHSDICPCLCS
jgi:hypothetical protein